MRRGVVGSSLEVAEEMALRFEWDPLKAEENEKKHGADRSPGRVLPSKVWFLRVIRAAEGVPP